MSLLRGRCPDCRAHTAVAVGPGYERHSCGRVFEAGLVRVPRAWGRGGEAMAEAARLELPYPEVVVVAEESLHEQTLSLASELPERPLVLGGCCCAHVGAVEGLTSRYERLALVWLDAHGDLNTPETSPSGNLWARRSTAPTASTWPSTATCWSRVRWRASCLSLSGFAPEPRNVTPLSRLLSTLGL